VGISIYFKQLKTLVCMLVACSVFSLPAFYLFWASSQHKTPQENFDETMLALSLGSLGEPVTFINELDLSRASQPVQLFCETGVIERLTKHGVAVVNQNDKNAAYLEDTFCGTPILPENSAQLEA